MPPLLSPADLGYEPLDKKLSPAEAVHQKRTVSFLEERNSIREFEGVDIDDLDVRQTLWHQPADMIKCKTELRMRAREWRKTGLGILLNDTFEDPNPLLCQKRLNAFAQLPEELYNRGCERYLSKQHDMQRTQRKRSNLQEVLAQAYSLDGVQNMPLEERQNVLALFARHRNRDAELFARRMGKADEVAVQEGEDGGNADIMVEYLKHLEKEKKMEKQRRLKQQQEAAAAAAGGGGDNQNDKLSEPNHSDSEKTKQSSTPTIQEVRLHARQA